VLTFFIIGCFLGLCPETRKLFQKLDQNLTHFAMLMDRILIIAVFWCYLFCKEGNKSTKNQGSCVDSNAFWRSLCEEIHDLHWIDP